MQSITLVQSWLCIVHFDPILIMSYYYCYCTGGRGLVLDWIGKYDSSRDGRDKLLLSHAENTTFL